MNVLLTMIRTVCKYSQVDSYHGYHICPHKCFFGDEIAFTSRKLYFYREILMFLACHSNVSRSHGESLSVLLFASPSILIDKRSRK